MTALNMTKISVLLFLCLTCLTAFGQRANSPICPLPLEDNAPSWAALMYKGEDQINVYALDSTLEQYYKARPFVKDNYFRAYKRWRKSVASFVMEDGRVDFKAMAASESQQINPVALSKGNNRLAASTWAVIGPMNTFEAEGSSDLAKEVPWQVNIYAFDVAPTNESILYAGTETGGIFKTTDKGKTWTFISKDLARSSIQGISVSSSDPDLVLVSKGSSLLKTSDGGVTWTQLRSFAGLDVNEVKFNPSNPNIIYVATSDGLYRSVDQGVIWARVLTGTVFDIEFDADHVDSVYVCVQETSSKSLQFHRSADGGNTFTPVTAGLDGFVCAGARMAVSKSNANVLYIVSLNGTAGGQPYLFKSKDGGATWNTVATGSSTNWGMNHGQGYYDLDIEVSPSDENIVFTGTTTLFKSTDGGVTHTAIGGYAGPFRIHPDVQCIKIRGNYTWVATDGGFTYSTDYFTEIANAHSSNNGIFASDFWGFDQGWNEDLMVGGRYHNGNTALYQNYPVGNSVRLGGAEDATGVVMLPADKLAAFRDIGPRTIPGTIGGQSVRGPAFSMYPNQEGYGAYNGEVVYHPQYYNTIFLTKDNQLWKSVDAGVSYTALHDFAEKTWRIEIPRSNPSAIYVSTSGGIYKSSDNGSTFAKLSLPKAYQYFRTDLAVNPENENELVILVSNDIYKTTDSGASWTKLTTAALAGRTFNSLIWHPGTNGGIYLTGVQPGASVYYRDNDLTDWTNYSDGLPFGFSPGFTRPFFKKSKLRLAGNLGVWEAPLISNARPIAGPWVSQQSVRICEGPIQFNSYSVADDKDLTYQWSFPTGSPSSANVRNPEVLFTTPGEHLATLTVSNAYGSDTKTISIIARQTACEPDTLAGKSLDLTDPDNYVSIAPMPSLGNANNSVTFMAWVKPKGIQKDYSGIIVQDDSRTGLFFNEGNNSLGYMWNNHGYWERSGLVLPADKWSHIAMVMNGTECILYVNGVSHRFTNSGSYAKIDFTNRSWDLGTDRKNSGVGSRNANFQIEELRFYNAVLSRDQIREKMHIIPRDVTQEQALIGYYQFNQYDPESRTLVPTFGEGKSISLSPSFFTNSTAPIATGTSFRISSVSNAGLFDFTGTGLKLEFSAGQSYPNGELLVSRLDGYPNVLPGTGNYYKQYWVVRNYGANQNFGPLNQMKFSGAWLGQHEASSLTLFKRGSNEDLGNWESVCNGASSNADTLNFGSGCNITSFSQFVIESQKPLPLRLISFEAASNVKNEVQLDWRVSEDNESASYELMKSLDGITWHQTIHKTISEKGDRSRYQFTDRNVQAGWVYYRLRLVGNNKSPFYSRIVAVFVRDSEAQFNVYPVPVGSKGPLTIESNLQTPVIFTLFDQTGKEIYKGEFVQRKELSTDKLTSGIYIMLIKSKDYMEFKKIMVK